MSAGSKTNPGGYGTEEGTLEQFEVSAQRSPNEICEMLRRKGYDPVWKDWDSSYDRSKSENQKSESHIFVEMENLEGVNA